MTTMTTTAAHRENLEDSQKKKVFYIQRHTEAKEIRDNGVTLLNCKTKQNKINQKRKQKTNLLTFLEKIYFKNKEEIKTSSGVGRGGGGAGT